MANITATKTQLNDTNSPVGHGPAIMYKWATVTEADTALAVEAPISLPDRTFQVIGTFGSSTTVLQGSLDGGTTYKGLRDPGGTAISFTSADLKAVLELVRHIKPVTSGGTGQSLDIYLLCSGGRRH